VETDLNWVCPMADRSRRETTLPMGNVVSLSNYLQQQQQQQPDDVTDDGLVLMDTVDNEAVRDLIG